ncbi:MAG: hypothetical protein BMS9Abin33_0452 [Gammaproteobacteria bacterium]|nr:MAG: hypothetical protein BMS9Abin33_0452 [Gammaproteobacteria bacterium]
MATKFLIVSPPYDERVGGAIVLHKLSAILNELGYESYLHPYHKRYGLDNKSFARKWFRKMKDRYRHRRGDYGRYKVNPVFDTPVLHVADDSLLREFVVVYPEIVSGNPLNSQRVVRWFLHNPGFHTGRTNYGENELFFKYHSGIEDFYSSGSLVSNNVLTVIHCPLEDYNLNDVPSDREGTAYCLRKGKLKPIQHDLNGSVLIDGKSNSEIASIFKRVKTFISYDTYTAYSIFAVLCGCESIVVPDQGVTKEQWLPNPADRYGLAYGFSDVEAASETAHLVKEYILSEERKSIERVKDAVIEINDYFGGLE